LYLGVPAEAYGSTGQAEAGLTTLAEALVTIDKTYFYEAELYCLKGAWHDEVLREAKLVFRARHFPLSSSAHQRLRHKGHSRACRMRRQSLD
jgi:hypothetical protein